MKRYVKGVLGGILAILAAFGWTITLAFAVGWKDQMWGIYVSKGPEVWILPFLIFATGFYLAFRRVYSSNSK
jgi:hypothetical protein